jgi:hypothetical protein
MAMMMDQPNRSVGFLLTGFCVGGDCDAQTAQHCICVSKTSLIRSNGRCTHHSTTHVFYTSIAPTDIDMHTNTALSQQQTYLSEFPHKKKDVM